MRTKITAGFLGLTLIALFIAYGYYFGLIARLSASVDTISNDFSIFYFSAQYHHAGESLYKTATKTFVSTVENEGHVYSYFLPSGNLNPPFFNLIFLPIAKLAIGYAFLLWAVLSLAAAIAAIMLLQRQFIPNKTSTITRVALVVGVLCYFPTFVNTKTGQLGLYVFLLLSLLWILSHNKKDTLAGFLLGLLVNIKLFTGLFGIFFVVQRRWRLVIWSAVSWIVSSLCALAAFGKQSYIDYYESIKHVGNWYTYNWNASLYGFLLRMFGGKGHDYPLFMQPWLPPILQNICVILCLLLVVWFSWRYEKQSQEEYDFKFAFILVTMLFISPLGWIYYFPVLIIAYWATLQILPRVKEARSMFRLTWLSFFLSAMPVAMLVTKNQTDPVRDFIWANYNFLALAILMLVLIYVRAAWRNTVEVGSNPYPKRFLKWALLLVVFFAILPHGILGSAGALYCYGTPLQLADILHLEN